MRNVNCEPTNLITAQIRLNNDNYYADDVTGKRDNGQGSSFVIPYEYSLDRGVDVKRIVMAGAGPFGKPVKTIQNFAQVKSNNYRDDHQYFREFTPSV